MATLAAAFPNQGHTFWSVESFTGNLNNTVDGHNLPQLNDYTKNLKENIPFLNVNTMQLPGQFAADKFEDESVDLVFIDGAHDTDSVIRDIEVWLPKVKKGGVLCGDDIGWDSVEAGVQAKFGTDYSKKQSVWWITK